MEIKIDKYKNLKEQNLILEENKLTTIIGSNQSGKTTLAKLINKKIDNSLLISDDKKTKYAPDIKLLKKIDFGYLIDTTFNQLSLGEKQIYNMIGSLSSENKLLILDDSLSSVDNITKEKIFKIIKKELKNKTIINITSDVEESIYGDYIILLNNGEFILNEKTKSALTKEKEFRNCRLDLPFMASLSLKLKYYGLLDNLYLNQNKMVDKLWK
jgi:ABC-type multidrug transport system ATPase subunit